VKGTQLGMPHGTNAFSQPQKSIFSAAREKHLR